jgi:serine/threonine-protein phosphatase Stp1
MTLTSCSVTHPGTRRDHNEDALLERPDLGLWVVADGAGGHSSGEVASGMIVESLGGIPSGLGAGEMLAEIRLRMQGVHAALVAEAERRGPEVTIASTVVILCVRHGHFVCLWAGDSRIYRLRDGELQQVTRDHSLVQEMIDAGALREEEAESHPRANVITRAVGASDGEEFVLDKLTGEVQAGDRFLLCSDGLSKSVPQRQLCEVLSGAGDDVAQRLVATALQMKASDNVTAVVVSAGR